MTRSGINYLLSNGLISQDTGALKVFYNFNYLDSETYEMGGGAFLVANSVESGNQLYSGEAFLQKTNPITKVVTNYRNISDSLLVYPPSRVYLMGYDYYESKIKIHNSSGLFGDEFTFIIEGGKIPKDKLFYAFSFLVDSLSDGTPLHNKSILMSNLSGQSGWEIGLNTSNSLYFKTYDLDEPKILTYDKDIPLGENIWSIRYKDRSINISRYIPETESILTNSTILNSDISNGGDWNINSGNNAGVVAYKTGVGFISGNQTSSIMLSNFLYFDEFLSSNQVALACKALKSDLNRFETITSGITYDIIGTGVSGVEVSGLLYTAYVLSGSTTGGVTVTGNPIITQYSGLVGPSDAYYEQCSSGLLSLNYGLGASGITGYGITYPLSGYNFSNGVYIASGVSGVISTTNEEYFIESGTVFYETGYSWGLGSANYLNLYPRSISYIGPRYDYDFTEIITGLSGYNNRVANRVVSNYNSGNSFNIEIPSGFDNNDLRFYLNGAALRYESGSLSVGILNGNQIQTLSFNGDYSITGNEIIMDIIFTGSDSIENLWGVYDFRQNGGIQELLITGLNQYSSGTFPSITPSGKEVFFNGVKLYEGDSYNNVANQLQPTGFITGMTGIYFAWDRLSGSVYSTGDAYDYHSTQYFNKNSNAFYINGARKSLSEYVFHDIGVDIISGVNYLEKPEGTEEIQGNIEV